MRSYADGLRIMEALMELKAQGLISLEEAIETAKVLNSSNPKK